MRTMFRSYHMIKESLNFLLTICTLALFFTTSESCAPAKTKYDREYDKVWDEIVQSEAWTNSLQASNTIKEEKKGQDSRAVPDTDAYARPFSSHGSRELEFKEKYHNLVTRAYFKIIAEAQKADSRLRSEQEKLNEQYLLDQQFRNEIGNNKHALINKRYNAHRKMLEGLLSWNIFSEERTADLEFFKAENFNRVYQMASRGEGDETIIEFLEYRLADLYHAVD